MEDYIMTEQDKLMLNLETLKVLSSLRTTDVTSPNYYLIEQKIGELLSKIKPIL